MRTQPCNSLIYRTLALSLCVGGILTTNAVLAQGSSDLVIPTEEFAPTATEPTSPALPIVEPESIPVAPEPYTPAPEFSQPETPLSIVTPEPQPERVTVEVVPSHRARNYEAPATVVFSERSTGCEAVVSGRQGVPNALCAPVSASQSSVAGGGITFRGNVAAIGVSPLRVEPLQPAVRASLSLPAAIRNFYQRSNRPPGRLGNSNIWLIFPLAIPAPISSIFGWRIHPITGDQRFHAGTDLAAPLGTPVLAAYAGQVAVADLMGGYGLAVALDHNKGNQQTLYAHLSEIFVKPGERVKQGDVIGRVGSTGNSTGPHLHFEFRQLTTEGWVAMDAGEQLEYGLAQLVKALKVAQANPARVASKG